MFDVCIRSLKKQSDCKIVVYTPDLENQGLLESRGVEVVNFPKEDWDDRRMTCKIEKIYELMINSNSGDNIMCFDADLFFLKDPFDVFKEEEFDFFYTTRHYKCWAQANGGVWGFNVNEVSERFIQFYVDNLLNPTWEPYVNFRKSNPHNADLNNIDWWVDQDFLCVCHQQKNNINNGMFEPNVRVFDAKSDYNYIVTSLTNEDIDEIVKNKSKYILHFKTSSFGRWSKGNTRTERMVNLLGSI